MYTNCQELRLNSETCNAGKKWEINEDELLIKLLNENKSYEEIAKEFKRTVNSIKARIIDKIIFPEYNKVNIKELAEKYKWNDIEYLEKCMKIRMSALEERVKEKKQKNQMNKMLSQEKLEKKIEKKKIKTAGGQKYYDLLENIVERLERIEKKIDGYDFTE